MLNVRLASLLLLPTASDLLFPDHSTIQGTISNSNSEQHNFRALLEQDVDVDPEVRSGSRS